MLRIDRTLRHLLIKDTAHSNPAGADVKLRRRRNEQEDVDAYLRGRPWRYTNTARPPATSAPRSQHRSPCRSRTPCDHCRNAPLDGH
jgi:hypothetical protein